MKYAVIYLILINIITFTAYGLDKRKAEKDRWRIPEITLIILSAIGGSVGALLGMLVFHHKTKKAKFVVGVPVIFLVQVVAVTILLAGRIIV